MNWFQRYGIPGAVFWGFLIMWVGAFHNCAIKDAVSDTEMAKVIAAIAAGTFLPIGYLISVIGQLIYHVAPGIGIDTRARTTGTLKIPESFKQSNREWQQEMASVQDTILYLKAGKQTKKKAVLDVNDIRHVSEWMSKRMGMLVINLALILAVIVAILLSGLLTIFSSWQFDGQWFLFACILSLVLWTICGFSWWILSKQLVGVSQTMLSCLATTDSKVSGNDPIKSPAAKNGESQ